MESENWTSQLSVSPQAPELLASVLFDSIDDSITVQDAGYNVIRINKAVERIFGKDVLGKKCYRAYQGRDDICPDCPTQKVWAGGQRSFSSQQTGLQGTTFEIWAFPVMDSTGRTIAVLEHGRDITRRVKAVEDLKKSEALYHDLVETTQDLIWQCDSEGKYIYLNHSWEDVLGYRVEEMLGRPFSDFQSPEVAKRDLEQLRRILSQGAVKGYETVHLRKDGREVNLVFNAKAWRDKQGEVAGTMGAAYDITARKRAEQELARSKALLESVIEGTSDAVYVKDLHGRYVMCNTAASNFVGKKIEDILGRDDTSIFPSDEASVIMDGDRRIMRSGITNTYEEIMTLSDGQKHTFQSTKGPVRNDQCEIIGLFGVARDITDRNERRMLEAIITSMTEGLMVTDISRTLTYLNPAAETILGVKSVDFVGKPITLFVDPFLQKVAEPEKVRADWKEAFSRLDQMPVIHVQMKNGHSRREIDLTLFPVGSPSNRLGVGVLSRDVSREHEIDRMKSEFISTVSHELRTPMTSIFGFSELLLMRAKNLPDNQRMWVETIHRETSRLSSIVEDLLNVSRIEAGRLSLNMGPVDISLLAARVVEQIQTSHPTRTFHLSVPQGLSKVRADEDKLKQALFNLLDNAVKYSPDGGPVGVTAVEERGKSILTVSVSDQGLGIPEEEIPKLFARFHRVERPNLPRVTGNGLGLYITRALVEMMGGRIWVESVVDKGSTFHFSLPAVAAGDTSANGFDTTSPSG